MGENGGLWESKELWKRMGDCGKQKLWEIRGLVGDTRTCGTVQGIVGNKQIVGQYRKL